MPTDKQRRETARRRLERQLAERQQRDGRRRRFTMISSIVGAILVVVIIAVFLVATHNDDSNSAADNPTVASPSTTSAPTSASASASAAAASYPCAWNASGTASKKVTVPSTTTPPKTGTVTVSVKTTQGAMTFTLNRAAGPCTVASFLSLVQQKYYDNTPCHRLVTSGIYVLQCGDPTGTGSGGPGYAVPDEATGKETYPAGTIAMARTSSPDSGGSQFFIVYKDSPSLQQNLGALQYTVFGKVSTGLSVVDKVAAAGSDNSNGSGDGKPKLPITLTTLSTG